MARPELLQIHLYRTNFLDCGIKPMPLPFMAGDEDLSGIKLMTMDTLRDFFEQEGRASRMKPTRASIVGEDGRIVAEFRMEPSGPREVITRGPANDD